MRNEIEDGFGCAGLVPTLAEKRESEYQTKQQAEIIWLRLQVRILRDALKLLYEEEADYIRVNHLCDVHHNRSMQMARDALAATKPT